jgi:hypothetical protein
MKLTSLIVAAALFGIVDIVNDNMIAVEVATPQGATVIHADTTGTGCVFTEGQAIPIMFDSENNFVVTCDKVLDRVIDP